MLFDGETIQRDTVLESDVCIVGAGPAGIAIALELASSGVDVLLVESGGTTRESKVQRLQEARSVGYPISLTRTRARGVGGSSLSWSAERSLRSRPLDPVDFEERPGLPYSGWPFDRAHLDPYYERAHVTSGFGPYRYDVEYWEQTDAPAVRFADDSMSTTIMQFAPSRRWIDLREDLERSPSIRLLTHSTVVEIATDNVPSRVSRLRVKTLGGNEFAVRARRYVLALGGIENARLLLASRTADFRGVGNEHDVVGRFFMEHLSCETGMLTPRDPRLLQRMDLYIQRHESHGHPIQAMWTLSEDAVRREGLRNSTFWVHRVNRARIGRGISSARTLAYAARRRAAPPHLLGHLLNVVTDPLGPAQAYIDLKRHRRLEPDVIELRVLAEQAPNPASRVRLGNELDPLGVPKVEIDWRVSDDDLASIHRTQELLRDALEKAGIGRLERLFGDERPPALVVGNAHHMGTTRMHMDPKLGVVDADCRVHSVGNLFIAGSSVFPTCGYANPTLTLVALALRLSDHLREGGGV